MKLFKRFFPTPDFLTLRSVGMSISDTHIKFVEFDSGNKKKLVQKTSKKIPKGVVERGFIADPRKLTEALKEVRDMVHTPFVAVSVPDQKAYVYKTKVPASDNYKQLSTSVESTIEQNAPLSLDKVIFSFNVAKKEKNHFDVVVSVVPKIVIETYINVLQSAGFKPTTFELESNAVAKAVIPRNNHTAMIIMNVDDVKTAFYVISNNVVNFSLSTEHEDGGPNINVLRSDIKKIHNYWERDSKDSEERDPIRKTIVCGEKANDENLIKQIEEVSPVQVERANVWVNAFSFDDYIPSITLEESLGFAVSVGLALSVSEDKVK